MLSYDFDLSRITREKWCNYRNYNLTWWNHLLLSVIPLYSTHRSWIIAYVDVLIAVSYKGSEWSNKSFEERVLERILETRDLDGADRDASAVVASASGFLSPLLGAPPGAPSTVPPVVLPVSFRLSLSCCSLLAEIVEDVNKMILNMYGINKNFFKHFQTFFKHSFNID